jgi:hypothetical protein
MDPGQVVWLPGSGFNEFEEDSACQYTYGDGYYACGDEPDNGGTLVYCCI